MIIALNLEPSTPLAQRYLEACKIRTRFIGRSSFLLEVDIDTAQKRLLLLDTYRKTFKEDRIAFLILQSKLSLIFKFDDRKL